MRVAIGFDLDHTLAIDNKLERTALIDLAKELGVVVGANDIARLAQIDTLLQEMRSGRLDLDHMISSFAHSIRKDSKTKGIGERFREICLALVPHHVVALPGVNELFAGLDSRGIPHAILTNGWSPLQEKKAEAIRYTGPVLVSDAIGFAKPAAEAFALLADTFPTDACIWYVGDNPASDVRGSIDCGFEGIWYHEHSGVSYPSHIPAPSAVIDQPLDLLELVDAADAQGMPGRLEAMPKT
jgi:FMN phosphatase YigB (HAD superfamily)